LHPAGPVVASPLAGDLLRDCLGTGKSGAGLRLPAICPVSVFGQLPLFESVFLPQSPLRIVVAGACHLDRKALAGSDYVLGASNPVSVATCPGGVAHNVAQNLRLLGCDVELVTRLGQDAEGEVIAATLPVPRLGRSGVSRSATAPTAFHLIALQPDGEMLVAVALLSGLELVD